MASETKRATYEDLLALPHDVHAEVLDGVIAVLPSPAPEHTRVQRALSSFVGGPFDDDHGRGGPGGWWVLASVEIALGVHDIVLPDLAGWHRERLPRPRSLHPFEVTPDWVCEVLSPTTSERDRVTKRQLYARAGIQDYWLIDPEARVLEALSLRDGAWVEVGVYDDAALARIAPFDAIELEAGRLFPPRDLGDGREVIDEVIDRDDGSLSAEEQKDVDRMSADEVASIDALLLSRIKKSWRKIAMVVAMALDEDEIGRRFELPERYYAMRIRHFVEQGLIESQGNVMKMRHGEVRKKTSRVDVA